MAGAETSAAVEEAEAGTSAAPARRTAFSVITESYNVAEGGARERLVGSLNVASEMASRLNGEVLLADSSGDPAVRELIARDFPEIVHVDASGHDYDEAKMRAAAESSSDFVLFLDGDCIPEEPDWAERHLAALREPGTVATAGFTRYETGFLSAVTSVMDFGFLLPAERRPVRCYASNNAGFRRELLLESCPIPEGPMRCRCFYHAQLLKRRGSPVRMVPEAKVRHEDQPLLAERYRRGYDIVAACWVDPELAETPLLRLGPLGGPLLYGALLSLDFKRVWSGRRDLELPRWQALAAMPVFAALRLIDLAGITRALVIPKSRRRAALQREH